MKNMTIRLKKQQAIFIIVAFCLLLMTGIILYVEFAPIMRGEFTPEAWARHPTLRYKMIDDMEEKIDIKNLTRDEITDILGTNAVESSDDGLLVIYYTRKSQSRYNRYFILFSDDGKVEEAWITLGSGAFPKDAKK